MNTAEFLLHLQNQGIIIRVEDDNLRYTAPKGTITSNLKTELLQRKAEIILFLHTNENIVPPSLIASDSERTVAKQAYVAPHTVSEEKLAQIWSQVLGIKQVGIYDNFFEFGGDSLLALRLINRLMQIGFLLKPEQVFEHQTIAKLASVLDSAQSVTDVLPLTARQTQLLNTNLSDYAITTGLFEMMWMEPGLVEAAAQYINTYHNVLQAHFVKNGSDWQKIVTAPDGTSPCVYIDLSTLPTEQHQPAIESVIGGLQSDFHLAQGKLWRVVFFDLGKNRPCRLFIAIHQMITDEISLSILYDDFQTACKQLSSGHDIQLSSKGTLSVE